MNLDASQRAMVAARMANLPKHKHKTDTPNGVSITQDEAAIALHVSSRSVQRAKAKAKS